MPYPDNFNSAAFDRYMGTPAHENAIEREYTNLLWEITNARKPEGSQLTEGQKAIDSLVCEEELDGTLYAALTAAAKHLQNRKAMTVEQVGQTLIDALSKDLQAIAERRAADSDD